MPAASTRTKTITDTRIPIRTQTIVIVKTNLLAPTNAALNALHDREHSTCFACGTPDSGHGLNLHFHLASNTRGVAAEWRPPAWAIGYAGTVHGGLIATVLDSAMVHALFARGICAQTARLTIRYRHPVLTAAPCEITAQLLDRRGSMLQLEAALRQADRLCVSAVSWFGEQPQTSPFARE